MNLLTDLMKQKYSDEDRYSTLSGGQPQPVRTPSLPSVSPIGQTTPQDDWRSDLKEKQELANLKSALGDVDKAKTQGALTYPQLMRISVNNGIPVNIADRFSNNILDGQEKVFEKQREADRLKNIQLGFQEVTKLKEQNDGPLSFEQKFSTLSKFMGPDTALAFTKVIEAEEKKKKEAKKEERKLEILGRFDRGEPITKSEQLLIGVTTATPKKTKGFEEIDGVLYAGTWYDEEFKKKRKAFPSEIQNFEREIKDKTGKAPTVKKFNDGTQRQYNPATKGWDIIDETIKPETMTKAQANKEISSIEKHIYDIESGKSLIDMFKDVPNFGDFLAKQGIDPASTNAKQRIMEYYEGRLDEIYPIAGKTRGKTKLAPPGGQVTHTFIPGKGIVPK